MGTTRKKNYSRSLNREHRILHGLSCQWRCDVSILSPSQRKQLHPPFFALSDMTSRLAYWDGDKNTIVFSRQFATNHPWDDICEVLRHEIAHQLTTQLFEADHEPPHGPVFKHACRLIRANPRASGVNSTLRHRLLVTGESHALSNHYRRVRKLLALAQSHNQYEAEAALAKAYHLMTKYHVDLPAERPAREYHSIFLGQPALRHFRESYHLAQLVQRFCFVSGVWVPAFVVSKGKMGRVLEISGTPPNLQLAEYVFSFVRDFIDRQWLQFNHRKRYNRFRKTDFAIGIIEGFLAKMDSNVACQALGAAGDTSALMLKTNPGLKAYLNDRYPHTSSFRRTATSENLPVKRAGKRIGRRLIIAKPIENKPKKTAPVNLLDR